MKLLITLLSLYALAETKHSATIDSRPAESAETETACQKHWREWQDKFTSSSPLGAHKKLHKYAIGKPELEMLLSKRDVRKGKIVVILKEPLLEYDTKTKKVVSLNAFGVDPKAPADAFAKRATKFGVPLERNEMIIANLAQMVRDNPKGNLLIVPVGHFHSLEFFFKDDVDGRVMYGAQRIDDETTEYSDGFREFFNSIEPQYRDIFLYGTDRYFPGGMPEKLEKTFSKNNLGMLFQMELDMAYRANENIPGFWDSERLLGTDSAPKSNVLIVGENHFTQDHASIENLPSAMCLKEMGFTSVTFVMESQPRLEEGRSIEFIRADRTYRGYQDRLIFSRSGKDYTFDRLLRNYLPESAKIRDAKSIEPVTGSLLLGAADRISKDGLPVYFTGLESHADSPLEISERSKKRIEKLREWVAVDGQIQLTRKGLATSGSTALTQRLRTLWQERKDIEKDLEQYSVIPRPPASGDKAKPIKINLD